MNEELNLDELGLLYGETPRTYQESLAIAKEKREKNKKPEGAK